MYHKHYSFSDVILSTFCCYNSKWCSKRFKLHKEQSKIFEKDIDCVNVLNSITNIKEMVKDIIIQNDKIIEKFFQSTEDSSSSSNSKKPTEEEKQPDSSKLVTYEDDCINNSSVMVNKTINELEFDDFELSNV